MEVSFVSRRVSVDTFHRNFYQSNGGKLVNLICSHTHTSHIYLISLIEIHTVKFCCFIILDRFCDKINKLWIVMHLIFDCIWNDDFYNVDEMNELSHECLEWTIKNNDENQFQWGNSNGSSHDFAMRIW